MLIYRLLGGICLVGSGIWFYLARDSFQKKKCTQLDAYIKLLKYIKNQVECYMKPIDSIMGSCSPELLELCGIDDCKNTSTLDKALDGASFFIDEDAIDVLYRFSADYGRGYLSEQIRSCDRYSLELEELRKIYYEKRRKDKKLSLAISVSISLSLFLILL